jgi:hypothetical protein
MVQQLAPGFDEARRFVFGHFFGLRGESAAPVRSEYRAHLLGGRTP